MAAAPQRVNGAALTSSGEREIPHTVRSTVLRLLGSVGLLFGVAPEGSGQAYTLFEIDGPTAGASIGAALAGVGDVNSDGAPDFAVWQPFGGPGPGAEIGVYSGAGPLLLFSAPGAVSGFGWMPPCVGAAGDVDGDGAPDVVVGTPFFNAGPIPISGRVQVFSGATGAPILTVFGGSPGESTGFSVDGAGDVDGDGTHDIVAGGAFAPLGALFGVGRVRVFSGASGAPLLLFDGQAASDHLGWSVAGPGDLDSDGLADVAAGAPQFQEFDPSYPTGTGFVRTWSGANGSVLYTVPGVPPGYRFGLSIADVGDLDGDGVAEIVAGGPGIFALFLPNGPGSARVISGATGTVLSAYTGTQFGENFGASASGVGDADGDGLGDVCVGSPFFTIGSNPAGRARLFSGASGSPLLTVTGSSNDLLGGAVSGLGDANGDGLSDFLVGARLADGGGLTDAGQVKVLSYTGIPAGSFLVGAGCPGSGGFLPRIATAGGAPFAGNAAFRIYLSKALGSTDTLLVAGISSFSPPIDLSGIGVPGCALSAYPDLVLSLSTLGSGAGTGTAVVELPIPAAPSLSGGVVFFQWYVVDPGPGPIPGAISQGLSLLFP